MPGANAPAASRASKKHTSVVTTVIPERPGISREWFYGFLRALPGDRAFLPPSSRGKNSARLDTSVGVSGPHDFAVRVGITRPVLFAPDTAASIASRTQRP